MSRTARTKGITGSCIKTPVAFQRGVGSPCMTGASSQATGQTASNEWVLGAKRERLSSRFCKDPQASIAKMST
jgi:hypothetical protein